MLTLPRAAGQQLRHLNRIASRRVTLTVAPSGCVCQQQRQRGMPTAGRKLQQLQSHAVHAFLVAPARRVEPQVAQRVCTCVQSMTTRAF
eukprot:354141-Chlamydomonas_euryale.AAC.8